MKMLCSGLKAFNERISLWILFKTCIRHGDTYPQRNSWLASVELWRQKNEEEFANNCGYESIVCMHSERTGTENSKFFKSLQSTDVSPVIDINLDDFMSY